MTTQQASIIEEVIEDLESKMMLAIQDMDLLRAESIGAIIDWLKKTKNFNGDLVEEVLKWRK